MSQTNSNGCTYNEILELTVLAIGSNCNDNNPATDNDMITADCECRGTIPCENVTVSISRDICEGEEVQVGNSTYTQTGESTNFIRLPNGCDSIVNLNLTVFPRQNNTTTDTICEGQTRTFFGNTYDSTNTYFVSQTNSDGCTYNEILELTVLAIGSNCNDNNPATDNDMITADCECRGTIPCENITVSISRNICEGDEVQVDDNVYTETDNYTNFIRLPNGCDSIVNLNLTVFPVQDRITNDTICEGNIYSFFGNTYTTTATYTVEQQNENDCTYSEILNLVVLNEGEMCGSSENIPPIFTIIPSTTNPIDPEENISFDVTVTDYFNIISTAFNIFWDASILSFVSIDSTNSANFPGLTTSNFGTTTAGRFGLSWFESSITPVTVEDGTIMFSFTLTAVGGGVTPVEIGVAGREVINGNEIDVDLVTINTSVEVTGDIDASCNDGIQNQGEQDIDCGGPCEACPTCSDGIQNGDETDVDCGGSCTPCDTGGGNTDVGLMVSNATVAPDEEFCLDVTVENFTDMRSLQFSMAWNPSILDFVEVQNPTVELADFSQRNIGLTEIDEGRMRASWNPNALTLEHTLPNGTILFQICFRAVGSSGMTSNVSFSNQPLNIEVSDASGNFPDVNTTDGQVIIEGENEQPVDCPDDASPFCIENVSGVVGETVCVGVFAQNFDNILSFQHGISFNPPAIIFSNILVSGNLDGLAQSNFSTSSVDMGALSVSWFDGNIRGVTVPDGMELYQLCFKVLTEGVHPVRFSEIPVHYEIINGELEEIPFNGGDGSITATTNEDLCTDAFPLLENLANEISDTLRICLGDNVQLNRVNNTEFNYSWSGGILDNVNVSNPVVSPENTTNYTAHIISPDGLCEVATDVRVVVDSLPPNLDIMPTDSTVCEGALIVLTSETYEPGFYLPIQHQWSPSSGLMTGDSNYNIVIRPMEVGLTRYKRVSTNGACIDTVFANITVEALPEIQISSDRNVICEGEEVILEVEVLNPDEVNITEYRWSPSLSVTSTRQPTTTALAGDVEYSVEVRTDYGCPGTASFYLEEGISQFNQVDTVLCSGESLLFKEEIITEEGFYEETFTTINGCDSIVEIDVKFEDIKINVISIPTCDESVPTGIDTLATLMSVGGCDSLLIGDIFYVEGGRAIIQETICEGDYVELNGKVYDSPGVYDDIFSTTYGCDSLVTIVVSLRTPSYETTEAQFCTGESYYFAEQYLTREGLYKDTLRSMSGCDSIITFLDLNEVNISNFQATQDEIVMINTQQGINIYPLDNDFLATGESYTLELLDAAKYGSAGVNGQELNYQLSDVSFIGDEVLRYAICAEACPSSCDTASVYIQIYPDCLDGIEGRLQSGIIRDAMGDNACFDPLADLEPFCTAPIIVPELMIINTNSEIVYVTAPYSPWCGRDTKGNNLPSGTYYYAFRFRLGEEDVILKHWVVLLDEG